jgi:hypothetical protein
MDLMRVPTGPSRLCTIAAAGLLGGCHLSTDLGGTAFLCEREPTCPGGYVCVEGRCVPEGTGGASDAGADGGAVAGEFRHKLTFENMGRASLVDFPVMVTIDSGRVDLAALRPDGRDIVFLDADGTPLAHEIERWDPESTSIVWVRVPTIDGRSNDDFIWLYYGDPDVESVDDPAVWSRYEAVYHLEGDTPTDSTARGYDGTPVGGTAATGFLGRGGGREFDGVGEYVDLGTERDFARAALGVTIEGWLNPEAAQQGVVFGASVNADATTSRAEIRFEGDQTLRGGARTDELGDLQAVISSAALPLGEWSWVAVVCDFPNFEVTIYINGEPAEVASDLLFDLSTDDTPAAQASIGANETLDSQFFPGTLDEIRLAPTPLDADWIQAQGASMRDELISFGPRETL